MKMRPHSMLLGGIQSAYAASLWPAARQFFRALHAPQHTQAHLLQGLLQRNASSAYGRLHGFSPIRNVAAFQDSVPVCDYDTLYPWVERIADGEPGVLTIDPIRMLERTSGSTRANKLIPYTQGLLNQFSAATSTWQWDMYRYFPALLRTRAYWSISPSFRGEKTTRGGIPIGFEDDTEYFSPPMRWALNQCLAVEGSVKHLPDMDSWRLETARQLIECENLGLISVWSPTFLLGLLQFMQENVQVLQPLLTARARERLVHACDQPCLNAQILWPELQVISCWSDGISAQFMPVLRAHAPTAYLQGKGLLATEGVVSIPLHEFAQHDELGVSHGGVSALTSHFLEFIRVDAPDARPRLLHELEEGEEYSPLITTAGGLYRYHLKDIVRCQGYARATPLVEFAGKYDNVVDTCGEKLNAAFVGEQLVALTNRLGIAQTFALLAPVRGMPGRYVLYVESTASDTRLGELAAELETALCTSHHYRYARELGQLQPLGWQRVHRGWQQFQQALVNNGSRLGDIKPACLDNRLDWGRIFSPKALNDSSTAPSNTSRKHPPKFRAAPPPTE